MTVIQEMREAAALLPDGQVKKMLIWAELELGERADRIFELEDDLMRESDQYAALVNALQAAKEATEAVTKGIHAALWQPEPPARDVTSFVNCMAAHGVEPYAKKKRVKKEAGNVATS